MFKRRVLAFVYAFRGIVQCAGSIHFRIHLAAATVVVVTGLVLGFEHYEWLATIICCGMVLSLEAMNSALEELADEVSIERRPRIRRAKDMAAGAVLVAAVASASVFVVIVLSR